MIYRGWQGGSHGCHEPPTARSRCPKLSQCLLVLEPGAANGIRLAEGGGGALGIALDEQGDQEDNGDEEAEDDGKEGTKRYVKANGAAVDGNDARERRSQLLHGGNLHGHLGRRELGKSNLAASAQHRRWREGLHSSGEACEREDDCDKTEREQHTTRRVSRWPAFSALVWQQRGSLMWQCRQRPADETAYAQEQGSMPEAADEASAQSRTHLRLLAAQAAHASQHALARGVAPRKGVDSLRAMSVLDLTAGSRSSISYSGGRVLRGQFIYLSHVVRGGRNGRRPP